MESQEGQAVPPRHCFEQTDYIEVWNSEPNSNIGMLSVLF